MDRSPDIRVMSALAYVMFAALLAYSGLQVAWGGSLDIWLRMSAGPLTVYSFDVLVLVGASLLLYEAISVQRQAMPGPNRVVVTLVLGYCAYQLAVVFPIAVTFFGLEPIGVLRELEARLGLALVPLVYLVVLKYISIGRVVLLVNLTAVAVALHAVYVYATSGANFDVGKFRVADGHAAFLFAFLILTSLFLQRRVLVSYVAAMVGLLGLVMINHRSAYLALVAVSLPLVFRFRRASARTTVVLIVVISFAVLALSAAPAVRESVYYSLQTMVEPTADQNARDRLDRSALAWQFFVANPLGDHTWNQRYYLIDLQQPFEPHNFVMQILDQQGLVGFAFFTGIVVAVARIAWRNRASDRVTAVMLASFAFYLLFSLFNTTILNQWNILLLAVPAGIILERNAALLRMRSPQEAPVSSELPVSATVGS